MVFMAPKDEEELRHMLYTALNHPGPSTLRYPRGNAENVELCSDIQKSGDRSEKLFRKGEDMPLLPVGNHGAPGTSGCPAARKFGIDASVINPRFIKPLDNELIDDLSSKIGRSSTIEDNARQGGFGSSILELFSRCGLSVKTSLLAHPDPLSRTRSPENSVAQQQLD